MMLESYIAIGLIVAFAFIGMYGIVEFVDNCFRQGGELRDEAERARWRMQARIRGAIYDACRLDDPLVQYELRTLLDEYRGRK